MAHPLTTYPTWEGNSNAWFTCRRCGQPTAVVAAKWWCLACHGPRPAMIVTIAPSTYEATVSR